MVSATRFPGRRPTAGFTLMELIIVIAIIGILATIVMPNLIHQPQRARETVLMTDLNTMRDCLSQYHGDKGHWPSALDDLVKEGYLRVIPADPMTKSKETWQPVYEEESPDKPPPAETDQPEDQQPGVIDVHSGSTAVGLNGVPYNQW